MAIRDGYVKTAGQTSRSAPSAILQANPVVAVLRARHAREYAPVIEALVRGGVRSIELTLSTDGVFALAGLKRQFGADAEIGVGTVTSGEQARRARRRRGLPRDARHGDDVVRAAVAAGVPVFPGGLTPTELLAGMQAGATAVKLFPASTVGPGYLGQLRGPFPDMRVIPSGGIGIDDAADWIAAGALAVSLGGPLLRDAFSGGDLAALTARARQLSALVAEAVQARGAR